ncbi:MAG: hypothetical protein KatS3mg087_0095 [Patescibacteria group bacterium]|nr:MAG: hypothetical protein KatS3mg087_0095 [Patescibacteria group bacterium]
MANVIYNKWLEVKEKKQYGWDSGTTIRAMLAQATNANAANKDLATVQDVINAGFTELSASGYSRVTLANKTVTIDAATDKIKCTADSVSFGNIEAGKTVVAMLLYVRVGASDNPSADIPVAYIDTLEGPPNSVQFPFDTGAGAVTLVPPSNLFEVYQP